MTDNFYKDCFKDKRLELRSQKIMSDMSKNKSSILHQLSEDLSDKIGSYRFFHNDSVSLDILKSGIYSHCCANAKGHHVLCIQDTTEINYSRLVGKLSPEDIDIGPVGNKKNPGFFVHANIVIDPTEQFPLGLSSIIEWNRKWGQPDRHERGYDKLPIKEKESNRWLTSVETSKETLKESSHITVIGDRESDIYEELVFVPDERTDLLIRSSVDRRLHGSDSKLFEKLAASEPRTVYEIEVKGNKKRKDRIAQMTLRYEKVKICKPAKKQKLQVPPYVEMWAIECRELSSTVPAKEDPILWRLLTTHDIKSAECALNYVTWYTMRWQIEQFFRLMKSKGLNVEKSQLGDGASLKKLTVFSMQVALQVMQLTMARDGKNTKAASILFNNPEIDFLRAINKKYESKTTKQQNPFKEPSIAWAAWIVARLGKWSGYRSQAPPGPITMKKGLDEFFQQYAGWKLAIELME